MPSASSLLRLPPALLLLILFGWVTACSDSTSVEVITVEQVRLSPSELTLTVGESTSMTATALGPGGQPLSGRTITWSSGSPSVASVSNDGTVTGVGEGTSFVRAMVDGRTATAPITVTPVPVASVVIAPETASVTTGWTTQLSATARDAEGAALSGRTITWASTDTEVATVSSSGLVTGVAAGSATITATSEGRSGTTTVTVSSETPVFRHVVDPFLATPVADAIWEIPVIILSYLPTADGINLDVTKSPDFWSLNPVSMETLQQHLLDVFRRKKFALEEGSRFRGYSNPSAPPSIGIRVVEHITVYDLMPASSQKVGNGFVPDYDRMFRELGIDSLIHTHGVRQVWIAQSSVDPEYPSFDPAIHDLADARTIWESNMSSPLTGDISNSNRDSSDLPIYDHTYVVYGINFRRTQAEAIHNVGHQLEAILSHVNRITDGNDHLFWRKFVGQDMDGHFITGRAGWTHMPPNTTQGYDYQNTTMVLSDIEDWRPDGTGKRQPVNVNTWGDLSFKWPGAQDFPQRIETQWYIYWFQSMPGHANGIPLRDGTMTNWWEFFADWDRAIEENRGLATVRDGLPITIRNDFSGSVLLRAGMGWRVIDPGQSLIIYSDTPIGVALWDCGEPGADACVWDPYTLSPDQAYRVIQHPNGPVNNLTIVPQ